MLWVLIRSTSENKLRVLITSTSENICCGYSLEAPQKTYVVGTHYKHLRKHMLWVLIRSTSENICCGYSLEAPQKTWFGYSLEAPQWGVSNQYPQICLHGEIRKISTIFGWKKCLICSYNVCFPRWHQLKNGQVELWLTSPCHLM